MKKTDVDSIRAGYPLHDVVSKYVKLERDGHEYRGLCPFHNEKTASFSLYKDKSGTERYYCFGCGVHGDVVDFVREYHNVPFLEAVEIITGEKPVSDAVRQKRAAAAAVDVYAGLSPLPCPADLWQAGKRTPRLFNPKRADDEKRRWITYTPSMVFPYYKDGQLVGYVLRVDLGEGRKLTPTIRYARLPDGSEGWTHWHFDEPRPLYSAGEAGAGQVFICEGEKATDACARVLGVEAKTWPGGTNAVDKADWTQLAGRKVVIWPDADAPGWKAANEVAEILHGICPEVKIIDSRDHSVKGWDAADAEAEGMNREAVLKWGKARIRTWEPAPPEEPPPSASDDEPPATPPISEEYVNELTEREPDTQANDNEWQPFIMLGFNKGIYYYMPRATQQLVELTSASHTKGNLYQLAPLEYWETTYGGGKKMSQEAWDWAANALIQGSSRIGIFLPDKVRGRGAWMDEGRAVVHLGNVVSVNGVTFKPADVESNHIYEAALPLDIKLAEPATTKEANRLIQICERLTWENPLSAQLLAGWCVLAPVCGALPWRSHIWITGPASAGKSTVMKNIIGRVVGPVALYADGTTTEAGLRQSINHDARPVIFDEAESEDKTQAAAIQRVLQLARIASSGGEIVKGGQDGQARTYSVRSAFCFSSINTAVSHYADETRISKLVLRKNEAPDRERHYEELTRDIRNWLTDDFAARMFARSVANITTLLENVRTFTDAADLVVKNRRAADQIGPMLAGLYLCYSTKKITYEDAVDWIRQRHWDDYAALEGSNDEKKLLTTIMTHRVRVTADGSTRDVTIGELCLHAANVNGQTIYGLHDKDANLELGRNGLKYDSEHEAIVIANKAPALSRILENTPWSKDWIRPLRSLPGAVASDSKYFSAGLTAKGTRIPLTLLLRDDHAPEPVDETIEIPF